MGIPAKSWNAMKGKMEDSTLPEWVQYYAEAKAWEEKMQREKPNEKDFADHNAYLKAHNEWGMRYSCNAPNKPGYLYANNH